MRPIDWNAVAKALSPLVPVHEKPPLAKAEKASSLIIGVRELAHMRGTTPANIYQMHQRGQIPSWVIHNGPGLKFSRAKAIEWIEGERKRK